MKIQQRILLCYSSFSTVLPHPEGEEHPLPPQQKKTSLRVKEEGLCSARLLWAVSMGSPFLKFTVWQ